MTDTQLALLRTVITNPGDDAPRLVYADWLGENGQEERAEFIRVQCRIEEISQELVSYVDCDMEECLACKERKALRRRERELLDWIDVDLLPILHGYTRSSMTRAGEFLGFGWFESERKERSDDITVSFSRGFISRIECTADAWLRLAPLLVWREGERETCPEPRIKHEHCGRCNGTGTVPRPMPETVQPVERVRLTDFLTGQWLIGADALTAKWIDANNHSKGFTDDRYPGIVFELPNDNVMPPQVPAVRRNI